jgi:hypothetical protein
MKLYGWRLKENNYGNEAFVLAASKDDAVAALRATVPDRPKSCMPDNNKGRNYKDWEAWFNYQFQARIVSEMLACDGYEFIVTEPGQVIWTEKS